MRGRAIRAAAASCALSVVAVPVLNACSESSDFAQVDKAAYERNVAMPTTSIVVSTLPPSTTTTSQPDAGSPPATADAALMSIVGQFAADPGIIAAVGQLDALDAASLAPLLGLDPRTFEQLGLSLGQVQGLAALVAGSGLAGIAGSAAGAGASDAAPLRELVALATDLDARAIAAVNGLSREVVTGVVGAVSDAMDRVNPAVLALLAALLDHLDPTGLGALASSDQSTTSLLAVFAGAALRVNPALTPELHTRAAGDADLTLLVEQIDALGQTLDPREAGALAAVGSQMTPDGLAAMSQLVGVLRDPSTGELFERLSA